MESKLEYFGKCIAMAQKPLDIPGAKAPNVF
jgi:hypothetical protein